ncbi:methyltransferase, FxLD system [Parafrankia sp. FMc2]|uniref:methyltransferase, FxLD system n=1 Tax=Parafrankia sp. FMc2 TaxID=3233196 RepID=UPI0034D551E4
MTATAGWRQYNIDFTDRLTAGFVAAQELYPALAAAQDAGELHGWWYLRKQPWKLRYRSDYPDGTTIADLLDSVTGDGRIRGWTQGIYEPETTAFGGEQAMDIAHHLFHADSRHLLARAAQPTPPALGQREITVLLCSALLRAAELDIYEQGDVWAKVADLRPAPFRPTESERAAQLVQAMHRLMTIEILSHNRRTAGPLRDYETWIAAFEDAGQQLAQLARAGQLQRGLRAVLAHHIVFHANRAGLTTVDQAVLASLARDVVFTATHGGADVPTKIPTTTTLNEVTTISDSSAVSADQLREELTDRLVQHDVIQTAAVEAAFRKVPRHLFLPEVPVERAYANDAVYTKHDAAGVSISAASQPGTVAMMLRQLDTHLGERILEIGAGTGYNAALIDAIVGETGQVTTIDVDLDLVEGARAHLAAAGITGVEVLLGDGALGHPAGGPYDRIIATVSAFETPTTWLDQLAPDGRLILPLRLRGTNSRSIVFHRAANGWHSLDSQQTVFMPLRGLGDDARRIVPLTAEKDVTLQVHKDQNVDGPGLAGVLDTEHYEEWTGVFFPPEVSLEWMDLWLCLTLDNALMRMNVDSRAVDRGQVTPMYPWGSMATTRDADLAYLVIRAAPPTPDGGRLFEVGVRGHGPTGAHLARQVAEEIRTWDKIYRARTVRFEIPDTPPEADSAAGRFVLDRPTHPITVIWE